MKLPKIVPLLVVSSLAVACAAERKSEAPAKTGAQANEPGGRAALAGDADKPPAQAPQAPPPPPPAPAPQGGQPANGGYAQPPPNRGIAQAQSEVETAQRELDVAGGDCRNACRALGSMDRAAGRLCSLAQSADEKNRCDDAKTRVYTARDRVRSTCGKCEDVTVDRNAPIPSRP